MLYRITLALAITWGLTAATNANTPQYPPTDRLGLGMPLEGLSISPEESEIIRQALPLDDPAGWYSIAKNHAAYGYLTKIDVLMLNRFLMQSPIPGAQELLERLRAAITKDTPH